VSEIVRAKIRPTDEDPCLVTRAVEGACRQWAAFDACEEKCVGIVSHKSVNMLSKYRDYVFGNRQRSFPRFRLRLFLKNRAIGCQYACLPYVEGLSFEVEISTPQAKDFCSAELAPDSHE